MKQDIEKELIKAYEKIENTYNNKDSIEFASGFYNLDDALHGFRRSQLTIIAGRPSMGKTTLALNMAYNLVKNNKKVLFISCEMNYDNILKRVLCSGAEVDSQRVDKGYLQAKDWERLASILDEDNVENFKNNLTIIPQFIQNIDILSDLIREFANNEPSGIIFIDYFQLIKTENNCSDRYAEFSEMACKLKRLAVEVNLPIIVLAQLSRKCEERQDKRPIVADLAECDALAQHSDNIIFIYREEYWNKEDPSLRGLASLIIDKNKNGPCSEVELLFQANILKFKNLIKNSVF